MIWAYLLSRSFVPTRCAAWLTPHGVRSKVISRRRFRAPQQARGSRILGAFSQAFARWESVLDRAIEWYSRQLERVVRHRLLTVSTAVLL